MKINDKTVQVILIVTIVGVLGIAGYFAYTIIRSEKSANQNSAASKTEAQIQTQIEAVLPLTTEDRVRSYLESLVERDQLPNRTNRSVFHACDLTRVTISRVDENRWSVFCWGKFGGSVEARIDHQGQNIEFPDFPKFMGSYANPMLFGPGE